MNLELRRLIDQVSRDKGIDKELLVGAIKDAIRSAARKKYGPKMDLEVEYKDETGEIEVFQYKEVVTEVTDASREVPFDEAREMDPECELGDQLGIKMDAAAVRAHRRPVRQADHHAAHEGRGAGPGVRGFQGPQRGDHQRHRAAHGFGGHHRQPGPHRVPACRPRSRCPGRCTTRASASGPIVLDVKRQTRGPQIILSRTHPNFLASLFESEVPEISEGIVQVLGCAREPGSRSKIAVASRDSDVDPVGACVGLQGLPGAEHRPGTPGREDRHHPLEPGRGQVHHQLPGPGRSEPHHLEQRPADHGSHRAGRPAVPGHRQKGPERPVGLPLVGWRIDVKTESKYSKSLKEGYLSLLRIPGVGEITANTLHEAGYTSAKDVAETSLEDLIQTTGLTEKKASALMAAAQEMRAPKPEEGEEAAAPAPAD